MGHGKAPATAGPSVVTFRLIILQQAELDTRASLLWYRARSTVAAGNFLKELTACYESILAGPEQHRRLRGRIREARLARFPFKIYFEVVTEEILVLRVYHLKRSPRKRFAKG